MKKNYVREWYVPRLKKIYRIMKITTILLLSSICCMASSTYAQNFKISINKTNSSIINILKELEEKSEFTFFFNDNQVNALKKTSINAKNASLEEILDEILKNTGYEYRIIDRQVLIKASNPDSETTQLFTSLQQIKKLITGIVVDEIGESIVGVNVVEKGTTNGVVTNVEGKFSISATEGSILRISFIGYLEQEVEIKDQNNLRIILREDLQRIDEVIVIGYGSSSTRKINTAASKIETETIKNMAVSNMASALSGLGRGLILKHTSGGPGWDIPDISIRGGGDPLYVIDGIISTKNDFARLSTNDVEDVTLLKDAGASAVYGSRAANGVILITTKNPNSNKISYSNNFSWGAPTVNPDHMDSYEYVSFCNRIANAYGVPQPYSDDVVEKYRLGNDPDYTSTIYYDEVFKKYSSTQRHNLTLQGKEESINYVLSLNYQTAKSKYLISDSHYQDVYSVMGKIGKEYKKLGIKINAKLGATIRDYKTTPFSYYYIFIHANTKLPILNPFNSQGNYKQIDGIYNPYYMVDPANGYERLKDNVFTNTVSATWDLPWVKGLQFGITGNYGISFFHNKSFTSLQPFYDDNDLPIYQEKPSLSESKNNWNNWTIQAHVNYKKQIDKHSFDAALYYEAYEYKQWNLSASRKDYTSDVIDQLFFGAQAGLTNSGSADESARLSYIGRGSYDYNDKYFVSGSFRYDASERFRPEDRWGFFPSFSLGWRISKEPFTEALFEKFRISNLKLRFSYGQVGNDNIARFAYLSTYNVADKRYYLGNEWVSGIYSNGLPAGDISWYKQENYNGGIDIDFFNNRLKFVADAFYYRTSGFLRSPQVDYTVPLGFSLPQINSGSQRRGGFELAADWKEKTTSGIEYSFGANFTYFEQLWEDNPGESMTTTMNPYSRTNHQNSNYYTIGYQSEGYYTSMDEILNHPRLNGQVEMLPGDLKFIDANGDGKIDSYDKRRIGKSTFPNTYFGVNMSFAYKGFYVNALFQGAFNYSMTMDQIYRFERGASSQTLKKMTDIWTPDNTDARFPRANLNSGRGINYNQGDGSFADFWLVRGDYVRLRNVEIGYDLKRSLMKRVTFVEGINIFFNGTNLFTIAPQLMGLADPENLSAINASTYPIEKTFSLGVNIDF